MNHFALAKRYLKFIFLPFVWKNLDYPRKYIQIISILLHIIWSNMKKSKSFIEKKLHDFPQKYIPSYVTFWWRASFLWKHHIFSSWLASLFFIIALCLKIGVLLWVSWNKSKKTNEDCLTSKSPDEPKLKVLWIMNPSKGKTSQLECL